VWTARNEPMNIQNDTTAHIHSRGLNMAVVSIARRLMPTGWDVLADDTIDTLDKLTDHVNATGRIAVWGGASEDTIFGDREVNIAFRAWHDWCHVKLAAPFTMQGEISVVRHQISQLFQVYGVNEDSIHYAKVLAVEVVRQAEFHAYYGTFPTWQKAFDLEELSELRGDALTGFQPDHWRKLDLNALVDDLARRELGQVAVRYIPVHPVTFVDFMVDWASRAFGTAPLGWQRIEADAS
jgi:hypothetical protein